MRVAIVSPEREVWTGEGDMVIARTVDGDIGVLPRHQPTLGVLVPDGEVTVRSASAGDLVFAVDGGFLSVTTEGVSILAESAEPRPTT